MPRTEITVFCDVRGEAELLVWLGELKEKVPRAHDKVQAYVKMLYLDGNALRRPVADYLRDGIYELRPKVGTVNYRVLYFFSGAGKATLSHGLTKEGEVPDEDIELAIENKRLVEANFDQHTKTFTVTS